MTDATSTGAPVPEMTEADQIKRQKKLISLAKARASKAAKAEERKKEAADLLEQKLAAPTTKANKKVVIVEDDVEEEGEPQWQEGNDIYIKTESHDPTKAQRRVEKTKMLSEMHAWMSKLHVSKKEKKKAKQATATTAVKEKAVKPAKEENRTAAHHRTQINRAAPVISLFDGL